MYTYVCDNLMNITKDIFPPLIHLPIGPIVQLISYANVFEFTLFSLCHPFAELCFLYLWGAKVNRRDDPICG